LTASRTIWIYLTIVAALEPMPALFCTPVGELRYRSSLPTEMPTTRSVRAAPCVVMAAFRAASSLATMLSPAEHQMPRRRVVLVAMAAGMAEMGAEAVPPCWEHLLVGSAVVLSW
jgi:hypothetical protein